MKVAASMLFALALASNAALGQAPVAGDAKVGHQKTQMCVGCHGIPGWRTAYPEVYRVPMIHGQHQAYIVKALQSYRSGERSHPSMRAIAASLSDQDMAHLAAYYGAEPTASAAAASAPAPAATAPAPAAPATKTPGK